MVESMTDKATVEIGSPRAGRVAKRCSPRESAAPSARSQSLLTWEPS